MTLGASEVGTGCPHSDDRSAFTGIFRRQEAEKPAHADFQLRVLDQAGAAHIDYATGLDGNRPRVRLVDRTVPGRIDGLLRIDMEGPQVYFLRRLAVRREESRSEVAAPPCDRPHPRLLDELRSRTGGDAGLTSVPRLEATRHGLDEGRVRPAVARRERETMAEVETGPEPDLADDHEATRWTIEIERHDRHRVHAAPVQDLESIGSRGAAVAMDVARPETFEPQETRPRRVETLENPDPGDPFPRPDHDD